MIALIAHFAILASQVPPAEIDRILQEADKLMDDAKAAYEAAREKRSVEGFVEAGFALEKARIKYMVLQEIADPARQKTATDRLRGILQLNKLINDGRVAISSPPPAPKPAEADPVRPAAPPPTPEAKPAVDVRARASVPEAAKLRDAEKTVRDLFKDQYAKKAAADRVVLARTLLDHAGRGDDDPAARWVLFREAQDVAAAAGDLPAALEAADGTARHFDVDVLVLRAAAVAATAKAAKAPAEFVALADVLLEATQAHLAADQYDAAEKAVALAVQHAKRANDSSLAGRATALTKTVADAKAKHASMKKVLETLVRNSDDGPANLEMGQFLCLVKGSWDLGLRFLVKGSDATLKALAEKELLYPDKAVDQTWLGDGWWDLAEKEKTPGRKDRLLERALLWYEAALASTAGLARVRIEKRIAELVRIEEPSATGLVGRWLFNEGAGVKAADSSGKNNHGTLQRGVKWIPGKPGLALSFEGDGSVSCGAAGLPPAGVAQTITWSMQYLGTSGTQNIIVLDDAASQISLSPGFRGGMIGVWKWGGVWLVSTSPPSAGEWHSYAYTFDGKTHKLYVDGVLKDSSTVAAQTGPQKRLEFGRWAGGGGVPDTEYFKGALDEVRIYARALSEAEVRMLARTRK